MEGSRSSVFGVFAKCLCVLCVSDQRGEYWSDDVALVGRKRKGREGKAAEFAKKDIRGGDFSVATDSGSDVEPLLTCGLRTHAATDAGGFRKRRWRTEQQITQFSSLCEALFRDRVALGIEQGYRHIKFLELWFDDGSVAYDHDRHLRRIKILVRNTFDVL